MSKTNISWTRSDKGSPGEVWNPLTGCTKASEGCRNCWALELHEKRHKAFLAGKRVAAQYARPFSEVQLLPERLAEPFGWRKPRRVFVNSVSDLFHEQVPFEYVLRCFDVMVRCPQHTFQILTKRPARMLEFCRTYGIGSGNKWPAHVWAGVTVENQAAADERIPLLLQVPAAVRFLSCEPLLERVDLAAWMRRHTTNEVGDCVSWCEACETRRDANIDWVICGGESGPRARPFDIAWARDLRDQCAAAGTAFFFKQMGAKPLAEFAPGCDALVPHKDRAGTDPAEWPEDLRVQQFPGQDLDADAERCARGARWPMADRRPTPLHSTQRPSPEALAAAELLAPLPHQEQRRVLLGLAAALGLTPMPDVRLAPVKPKEETQP